MAGKEDEIATVEHLGGEAFHEVIGLKMEITEHFVGAPASNKLDHVGIDVSAEECHGTRSTEGARGDISGEETECSGPEESDGRLEGDGNVGGGDQVTGAADVVGSKGSVRRGGVVSEMENATDGRENWAELGVSTAVETDNFAADAIFLVGESERDEGGGANLGGGSSENVEATTTKEELNVTEAEGSGVGRGAGVFTGAEEEKES